MAAARALRVEGVDGAALEGLDRVFHKAGFVERIRVDHHLDVVVVGDRQAAIDGGGGGAPVLMQLEGASASLDLLHQAARGGGVALARKAQIHGEGISRLDHAGEMPGAGGAGGGEGARRRACAAAQHGGDARHEGLLDLLGADEMDMGVEAARREDLALARDDLRAWANENVDPRLDLGIARLADFRDAPVAQADIAFHDAPVIKHDHIGDDRVHGAIGAGGLGLAHAVANDLAAAEFHLFAIDGEILLDLDIERGVGEPHLVALGGAEHIRIGGAGKLVAHVSSPAQSLPITSCRKP